MPHSPARPALLLVGVLAGLLSSASADSVVVLNEVMYNPPGDQLAGEWLELHNQMAVDVDLTGWSIANGISFDFPDGTVIPGRGYLVVASDPAALAASAGVVDALGPFTGRLANEGETIELLDKSGRLMHALDYADVAPWPVGPDGSGFTLAKRDPLGGPEAKDWTTSAQPGGTPGEQNFSVGTGGTATTRLADFESTWRSLSTGIDPGAGWMAREFDDASWPETRGIHVGGGATLSAGGTIPEGMRRTGQARVGNPGFESGNDPLAEDWNVGGGAGAASAGATLLAATPVAEGRRSAYMLPGGSLGQFMGDLVIGVPHVVTGLWNESLPEATPRVEVSGASVFSPSLAGPSEGYRRFQSSTFTPGTATANLRLRNMSGAGASLVAWDSLMVHRAVPVIAQGTFEEPVLPQSPGFQYSPAGAAWTGSGFAYTRSNVGFGASALEGDQALALQGNASVSQAVNGWEVGRQYVLAWSEADRVGLGGNDYRVVLGGQVIYAQHQVTNGNWVEVRTTPFTATASTMTLTFEAFNSAGGDRSVFIDDIRVEPAFGGPAPGDQVPAGAVTHYFRRAVDVPFDPAGRDLALRLDAILDDGAVAYWNGQEVWRWNMPAGPVTASTRALSPVGDAAFLPAVLVDGLPFVEGENILAIEVHQAEGAPGDVVMGLRAEAILSPKLEVGVVEGLALSELSPASSGAPFVELRNTGAAAVDLAGYRLENGLGTAGNLAGVIPAGGHLAIGQDVLGLSLAAGEKLFLLDGARTRLVDAGTMGDDVLARPAGEARWLRPSSATPGSANVFALNNAVVINEIMHHAPGFLEVAGGEETERVVEIDHAWRYWQTGTPTGAWRLPAYNDAAWPAGNALLYVEGSPLTAPKNTPLVLGQRVYYFRGSFEFSGDPAEISALRVRPFIDDGAVFFLNGVEVHRQNMPEGTITDQTFASGAIGNAAYTGPFDVPAAQLREGTNVLAVQVHQASSGSSDIVFGMELELVRGIPSEPFRESPEEWVELLNTSASPVAIGGWEFTDGIEYRFSPNTVLAPGEHLVLAKDPVALAEAHPGIRILGPYDGSLSRGGERLLLVDGAGNPADEVEYSDLRPWSEFADGGGSSLELVDPRMDNSVPQAWAPSDESGRAQWTTFTRRGFATNPPNSNDPAVFRELVLGLLDSGEVLVDDVSVVEDPDGAAIQRIQNGTFSSGLATWRAVGNHSTSSVVADPDDASNMVLRLVAEGPTEHISNHIETTFVGNAAIRTDVPYEVSFRARWVTGSSRLNSRLYFNRLASTAVIPIPHDNGTPGRANSRRVANAGPTIREMVATPVVPAEGQPITVSAVVDDPDGVGSVTLRWRRDGEGWQSTPMTLAGGRHRTVLDGQPGGTLVQMHVEAQDTLGATGVHPADGAGSSFLVQWDDGRRGPENRLMLRLLMTAENVERLHGDGNIHSNARVPGTLVVEDRLAHQDVGVRLKGSGYGRGSNRTGFNIQFNAGELYRGVHKGVALDRNGGPSAVGASQLELAAKHVAYRVGGVPAMYDDVATILAPRAINTGSAQVLMARYGDLFLDTTPGYSSDGEVYEYELIYYPQETIDGNPESPKRSPNAVLGVDFRNFGDSKDNYRWTWLLKNRRVSDDYGQAMAFTSALEKSGAELDALSRELIDIDQVTRYGAFMALTGIADTYWTGTLPHNFELYVRPEDGKLRMLPWDSDHAFHPAARDVGLEPPVSYLLSKVTALPRNKRLLQGHAHDMMKSVYTTQYLAPWIRHYGLASGSALDAEALEYINHRRALATAQFPPTVPFSVTTNNGLPFQTGELSAVLAGTAWIDLKEFRIAGRPGALEMEWPSLTNWTTVVALGPGVNNLVIEALDFEGNVAATFPVTITSTAQALPLSDSLKLTEMMHDPLGGGDFEFIELQNTGLATVSLAGLAGTRGITFTLAPVDLAPGAHALVVRNLAAFEQRNGPGLPVVGTFTGQLANEGENVEIRDQLGNVVIAFAYADTRGWPLAADGPGHSLVPLERSQPGHAAGWLSYAGNWRASTFVGGSPGATDPEPPAGPMLAEVTAHTDFSNPLFPEYDSNDWIEIANPTLSAVPMEEWYLSDDKDDPRKWAFPAGFVIPAEGRVSLDEITGFHAPITTGFGLDKAGEVVLLSHLPGTSEDRVADEVRFAGQENGKSLSRTPEDPGFWNATTPTRSQPNASRDLDLVIDEIMYNPSDAQAAAGGTEYVRLRNASPFPVALETVAGTWQVSDGITYTFPAGTIIPPGESLVVVPFSPSDGAAVAGFNAAYGLAAAPVRLLGPYTGALSNGGERISLERPQESDPAGSLPSWVIVDELPYFDNVPFPSSPDGDGDALHRVDDLVSGTNPQNWVAAPPDPGRNEPAGSVTWWMIR